MSHHHVETIIADRRRQLTALAQVRGTLPAFDRQTVAELHHKDPTTLTDKDFEMIQTLTMRYITQVVA